MDPSRMRALHALKDQRLKEEQDRKERLRIIEEAEAKKREEAEAAAKRKLNIKIPKVSCPL